MSRFGAPPMRLAALAVVPVLATAGIVLGSAGSAYAMDSIYECNQYGGHQVALLVHSTTDGHITPYQHIQDAVASAQMDAVQSSDTGSGQGDTVLVCDGTYPENLTIGTTNTNLTIRSEDGPSHTIILGNAATGPVVTILDRGLSFGGPGEGFTISASGTPASGKPYVGVQLGVPGAQDTSNEDEACTAASGLPSNSPGCDAAAPADVTINDQIIDNIFTNFQVGSAAVQALKLDNTINSVLQQNLFQKVVTSVGSFDGIVVGGFGEDPGANTSNFTSGDSTNINAALFQNWLQNTVQGNCTGSVDGVTGHSTSTVNGIQLNGFLLDAQIYDNWLQQLAGDHSNCTVTAIFSNAYGTLENEQTGTLAPTNANIDRNTIVHVAASNTNTSFGIVLEPTPGSAKPQPQSPPPTCLATVQPSCKDTIPPSSYTVVDNELQDLGTAVDDEAVLGANSFIRFNNFEQALIGVQNGAAGGTGNTALDATNNWWGCELSGSNPPPPSVTASNHGCAALITPAPTASGPTTSWAPPQTGHVADAGDHHDHFDAGT